jgi:hypothetical protein
VAAAEDKEEQEGSSRLRVEGGALRLTFGADEAAGRTHGLAEFIAQVWVGVGSSMDIDDRSLIASNARVHTFIISPPPPQEEMDRFSGFWWAPDSKGLAYCAVDEAAIPPYAITHQVGPRPKPKSSKPQLHPQHNTTQHNTLTQPIHTRAQRGWTPRGTRAWRCIATPLRGGRTRA